MNKKRGGFGKPPLFVLRRVCHSDSSSIFREVLLLIDLWSIITHLDCTWIHQGFFLEIRVLFWVRAFVAASKGQRQHRECKKTEN